MHECLFLPSHVITVMDGWFLFSQRQNTIFIMSESINSAVPQKRYAENCKHRIADVHVGVNPQPGDNNMASNQPKLSTVFLFINRVVSESCNI